MKSKLGLLGASFVYTFSSLITSAIPFLLLPILTRLLTPTDYGIVAMFGIWLSILGVLVGLSVQGAIGVKYFDKETINIKIYVSSCMFILLTSVFFVLFCVAIFSQSIERYLSIPSDWIFIAILISGMQFVFSIRLSIWQVSNQPIKYGALQITQSAINAALSILLVALVGLAWEGRLIAIGVATLTAMLISLHSLWREGYLIFRVNFNYVRDALKFGVPLIPHVIGGMLLVTVDRIMLTNMLGVDSAGIYTVAFQIAMILNLLTVAINQAYAPWLYEQLKKAESQLNRKIIRYTYYYFIAVLVLASLLGLAAPLILSVMAGDQFRNSGEIVFYIAMGFAFCGMYFMVTNYVFYAGATGKLSLNTIAVGVINIMLTFLLIEQNGVIGAGQSFMISNFLLFLGTWRLAARLHPMPWFGIWFGRDVLK